ncbi:kinesin-like protein KIF12 isoform X3 [Falco naumanni]|uniref:kinesin-like protein KIF12 isoform X3 n=1 Tax=Falco naumanni TaxID=148594 RepID=UPI001ADE00A3|nr:kinesin-like protein KIF12 isoform X3 [Falco naumanni]
MFNRAVVPVVRGSPRWLAVAPAGTRRPLRTPRVRGAGGHMEPEGERGWDPQPGTRPRTLPRGQDRPSPGEEREGAVVGRETRLRVVLRVRPLTCTETRRGDQRVVHSLGDGTIHVSAARHDATFGFSAVFDAGASQEAVFEGSGMRQLVELAIDGFSCTVFAFGQTGSGKTYTLMGPLLAQSETQPASPALLGLMQRSFACLLEQSRSRGSDLALSASYLEIYNEQVRDLLSPGPPCALPLRWSKTHGFYVENQLSVDFESLEAIANLLLQGSQRRQTSAHALNRHSSRSHALLTINVRSRAVSTHPAPGGGLGGGAGALCGDANNPGVWGVTSSSPRMCWWGWGEQQGAKSQTQGLERCCGPRGRGEGGQSITPPKRVPQPSTRPGKQGTLCFVDLAGSERVKETGSSGELSVEANNINRSLLALGHCISLLAKPRGKRMHIPYRDSKLTRLLARSLGGSGVTLMVACISPSSHCLSETLSTLHYASRARRVTTRPLANRVSREKLLQTLEKEIHALQLENLSLRQQLCLPRVPARSMEMPGTPPREGARPGWGGRYGPAGLRCSPVEGQLPSQGAPAWPSLYGLLRDFVVENEQLRATRSSGDGQPLLPSARTPHVPTSHPTRLQQPDTTPASGSRLPVSMGGPGSTDILTWGEDARTTHPLISSLAEAASCLQPPWLPPVLPWAGQCHRVPGTTPGVSSERGGTAQCSSLTALLTPRCCQGPSCRSRSSPRETWVSCHPARRTRLCLAPISSSGTPRHPRESAGAAAGAGARLSGTCSPRSCQALSAVPAPREGSSLRPRRGRDYRSQEPPAPSLSSSGKRHRNGWRSRSKQPRRGQSQQRGSGTAHAVTVPGGMTTARGGTGISDYKDCADPGRDVRTDRQGTDRALQPAQHSQFISV